MSYVKALLFSVCLGICYYLATISAIGIAAAHKVFWWFEWNDHFAFYHIAQNFFGIGISAALPAYLISQYEPGKKWLCIAIVITTEALLHGNINYAPWDPDGLVRFILQTVLTGDAGAIGIFLEILLLPVLWLLVFSRRRGPSTSGIEERGCPRLFAGG